MQLKFLLLLSFLFSVYAEAKSAALTESISVTVEASGDLKGRYELSGPLGAEIKSESEGSPCSILALFRKVVYRNKNSVEAWLTLDCTFEGQKSSYKTHRIYLDLETPEQKVQLPMLAKNLKNVQLKFQELSLVKGK